MREVTCLFAITSKIDISNSVNWYSIYCVYVPQLAARGLPKRRNHGRNMRRVITPSVNYSRHIATGWNIAGLALQILFTNFLAIIQKKSHSNLDEMGHVLILLDKIGLDKMVIYVTGSM